MKILVTVLLSILCIVHLASAEPFTASSMHTGFSVAGEISGDLSIRQRKVTAKVSEGKIVRQPMGSSPERKIIGIRAFLAEWTADKKTFHTIAMSDLLPLNRIIGIGESISIDGEKFEIPTANLSDSQVKNTWLGFEIVVESVSGDKKGSVGTCYVHTTSFLGGRSSGFPPERQ